MFQVENPIGFLFSQPWSALVLTLLLVGAWYPGYWLWVYVRESPFRTGHLSMVGAVGYGAIVAVTALALYIVQQHQGPMPWLFGTVTPYLACLVVAMFAAGYALCNFPQGRPADQYHTYFLLPLMAYCAAFAASIVFLSGVASQGQMWFCGICFFILLGSMFVDWLLDIGDQPKMWTLFQGHEEPDGRHVFGHFPIQIKVWELFLQRNKH